jgi:chromosome segregation ATPase
MSTAHRSRRHARPGADDDKISPLQRQVISLQQQVEKLRDENRGLRSQLESGDLLRHGQSPGLLKRRDREITDLKRANQEYSEIIAAIVEAAGNHFNETIQTPEDLCEIFNETVREEPTDDLALVIQVRRERRLRKAAERQLREVSKQQEQGRASLDSAISEFQRELGQLQERAEKEKHEAERAIAERDAEIQSLKEWLERERAKRSRPEMVPAANPLEAEVASLRSQNAVLSAKFSELENRLAAIKRENSELTVRATHAEETHRRLKGRIEESDRQIEQLATELQRAEKRGADRDSFESQLSSATLRIQEIQATLKQNEMKLSDARNSVEKLSTAVAVSQKSLNDQKDEISKLYTEREQILSLLHKQNFLLTATEEKYIQLRRENQNLQRAATAPIQAPARVFVPEQIPETSWLCPEFPAELVTLIEDLGATSTWSSTVRLRHVLTVVAAYYNKQLQAAANNHQQTSSALESHRSFLADLSTVVDSSEPKQILAKVSELKSKVEVLEGDLSQRNSDLKVLFDGLGAHSLGEADASLKSLQDQVDELQQELSTAHVTSKRSQRQTRRVLIRLSREFQKKEGEVKSLNAQISQLTGVKDDLDGRLQAAQGQVADLQRQLEQSELQHRESLAGRDLKSGDDREEEASLYDRRRRELEDELAAQRLIVSTRDADIETLQREVARLQRTVDLLSASRKEKDDAIRTLQSQMAEGQTSLQSRFEREVSALKQDHDRLVHQLKAKQQELVLTNQTTAEALANAESRLKTLTSKNHQLGIEKEQLVARIDSMGQEFERQRQLVNSRLKVMLLASETSCHNQIEETKAQFELEKRKIYAGVANRFRQFYDARKALDDEEFEKMVEKVVEEIARMKNQDLNIRRLLGLELNEPPENAISKLIFAACRR